MAWTPPATFGVNEIVTASKLNTHVRDNMKEVWHEVAYVEFTATVSSSSAVLVDVVSAGSVTYAGFPILVEFYSPYVAIVSTGRLALIGDGTDLGNLAASNADGGTGGKRRLTPSAAAHTYKVQIAGSGGGGTSSVVAGAGGVATNLPGFIRILEKGGS